MLSFDTAALRAASAMRVCQRIADERLKTIEAENDKAKTIEPGKR